MNDLDSLYSPSQWSKRQDVLKCHLEFCAKESKRIKKDIPCLLDVAYGEKERQKYDIYGTDLPKDSPIFIYVHGGYWQELSKEISNYVVRPFYQNKIKSIVIGYTLCPDTTVKEIIEEIERAVKQCIEYAKQNGSKNIYMSGYSAGSHLIASLFSKFYPQLLPEDQKLFKGIILCCGIYDITPLVKTYINDPLKLTHEQAQILSPIYQDLKFLNFTLYIVVGEHDSPAFKEQSRLYFDKIKSVSHKALYKVIESADHFSIVERFSEPEYELTKFILDLEKKFRPKPATKIN